MYSLSNLPPVDTILESAFWPELVRVVNCRNLDGLAKLEVIGETTNRFSSCILFPLDLAALKEVPNTFCNFTGRSKAFFLGLETIRIRFAHQFDPFNAISISQVDPLPHQIQAVYYVMLQSSRLRFMLADDPGAGKTIMAGLVFKELKYRGLIQRVLVVAPGHLADQWQREMKERFSETFTLLNNEALKGAAGPNPWQTEKQIITSMDFMRQEAILKTCTETHWDLVIVDEAHKMAAYLYGKKLEKTQRYRLGELLSKNSQFMLLLTATPHRGNPENFRLLFDLLNPGLFPTTSDLEKALKAEGQTFFLRRLKEDLRDFDNKPLFPSRTVHTIEYSLRPAESDLYEAVTTYVEENYNRASKQKKNSVTFALLILQRRLASSLAAVAISLQRKRDRLTELLRSNSFPPDSFLLPAKDLDEETFEEAEDDNPITDATSADTKKELQAEITTLENLINLATQAQAEEVGAEAKLAELRKVIEGEHIKQTKEKLLIFTEYKDTLDYLAKKLREWHFKVVTLHGQMTLDERIQAERAFKGSAQIMISTEAGGEGINLQFCALMVNYDLPWNPNRLEQRMGRIHRYGQQKEVHIYNLVARETREGKVMLTLLKKLDCIREACGNDRVFDVIGDILPPDTSLNSLIADAVTNRRTLKEILATIEKIPDSEAKKRITELTQEALSTHHLDLQQILGDQRRAKENRLLPEFMELFFQEACKFLKLDLIQHSSDLYSLNQPHLPRLVDAKGSPFPNPFSHFTFDRNLAKRHQAQFVAPGHPFLEAILQTITAKTAHDLTQGANFIDPSGKYEGLLWFVAGEIRDGFPKIVGKRLFALYQPCDPTAPLQPINPTILWDLSLSDQKGQSDPPLEPLPKDTILAAAARLLLEPYRQELLTLRQRDAKIKKDYGLKVLKGKISDSDDKLLEYYDRAEKGELNLDQAISREERDKAEFEQRYEELERQIKLEVALLAAEPQLLGVARVSPNLEPSSTLPLHNNPVVEKLAMDFVLAHERAAGRSPEDVSAQNLGYDILSLDPTPGGKPRAIEVKGLSKVAPIILTRNEWLTAQRLRTDFWLYVVYNCATKPQLEIISDPFANLPVQEYTKIVRFIAKNWLNET